MGIILRQARRQRDKAMAGVRGCGLRVPLESQHTEGCLRDRIRLGKEHPLWDQPSPTNQLEGDFYHIKSRALPSGRVWGAECPPRQCPGRLPWDSHQGDSSQKKQRASLLRQGPGRLPSAREQSYFSQKKTWVLPSDRDQGNLSQRKTRASPLRKGPQ